VPSGGSALTRTTLAATIVVTFLLNPAAHAQPLPRGDRQFFDRTQWTLLGFQTVTGGADRDVIEVAPYQGRFDQISLLVLDSDLELFDLTVIFGNGERWSPRLRHFFREGSRSHQIDLPGEDRMIRRVELTYGNLPGGGRARLEIYGRASGRRAPPNAPAPPAIAFDSRGWTLLGSQMVSGRRDRDVIRVGPHRGRLDQLTLVVHDSDLELLDLRVVFRNGTSWSPQLRHFFREGSRSRVIDLPGNDRVIKRIELVYANLHGRGRARVEVHGRSVGRPPPPKFVPVHWNNQGWTFLGKTTVDGWRDRDRLQIETGKPFSKLMFVVTGSDVEIYDAVVTFTNGEKFAATWRTLFREGTRTSPVDLPGRLRGIQSVEFRYGNLPGGGRASVEVWAQSSGPHGRFGVAN
jgi:hypothetical protein